MDILQKEAGYQRLDEVLEPEMVKQYKIRRGQQCVYMPLFGKERYLCSCGTVNPLGQNCYVCGLEPEPLTREVLEELGREAQERLAKEAEEQAQQENKRLAREEARRQARQKRKIKRIAIWSGSGVAAVVLSILLFWAFTRFWIPALQYEFAQQALEAGNYSRAYRLFSLAKDYADAQTYVQRFSTPILTQRTSDGLTVSRTEYTYDSNGNRLIMTEDEYRLDVDGREIQTDRQSWINHYNDMGNPVQLEDFYGKASFTYNENGDVTIEEQWRPDGVQERLRYYSYVYDDMGRITEMAEICSELVSVNYSYEQNYTYTYDEQGRVHTTTVVANYPAATEGNSIAISTNTYDDQDRLVQVLVEISTPNDENGNCQIVERWVYDSEGRCTSYIRQTEYFGENSRNSKQETTTVYNEQGKVEQECISTTFPGDGQRDMLQTAVYTYDREGRLSKQVSTMEHSDELRQSQSGYRNTVEYSYDLMGRMTSRKTVYEHEDQNNSYAITESFTYRWDGTPKTSKQTVKSVDGSAMVTEYTYNENGLVEKSRAVDGKNVTEQSFTYAYFYK